MEMAQLVKEVTGSASPIEVVDYEPGERKGSGPLREWIISTMADKIGMKPKIDFRTGVGLAAQWLREKMEAGRLTAW